MTVETIIIVAVGAMIAFIIGWKLHKIRCINCGHAVKYSHTRIGPHDTYDVYECICGSEYLKF